jgi:hypothetical protein
MTNDRSGWLKLPLLLSLLLLVPRVGLAAQDAPEARIPGTDERESRRLLDDDSWAREPERTGAPMGLRIMAEVGAGGLTALGGGLAGGLLGVGLCEATGGSSGLFGCLGDGGLGLMLGAALGYPLGVWWGGDAAGGDGNLLVTMAGMGGGVLVAVVLGLAMSQVDPTEGALTGLVSGLAVLSGPVVAYELSQKREPRRGPAVASSRPRLQPLLSVTSRGAVLGLGGRF